MDGVNVPLMDNSFTVTDGARIYNDTLIEVGDGHQPLLMFLGEIPPPNCDLWIINHNLDTVAAETANTPQSGVNCFTPDTR